MLFTCLFPPQRPPIKVLRCALNRVVGTFKPCENTDTLNLGKTTVHNIMIMCLQKKWYRENLQSSLAEFISGQVPVTGLQK